MNDLLAAMLKDVETADTLYRPTNFWSSGLRAIVDDIDKYGIETFRAHSSAHHFYVPLYMPGAYGARWKARVSRATAGVLAKMNRQSARRLRDHLVGADIALRDYLILRAAYGNSDHAALRVTESAAGKPVEKYSFGGRQYSRSMLNYLKAIALLEKHADLAELKAILEIGGGFGTLGEIAAQRWPNASYIDVDIPPVAAVATYYLQSIGRTVLDYVQTREQASIEVGNAVLCSWQLPRLVGSVDLFVNLISFQEMEPPDLVRNQPGVCRLI